jgi:hypothetical protein
VPTVAPPSEVTVTTSNAISLRAGGLSLLFLIVSLVLFLVSAFGVGDKLGFNLVDLGLACFVASFIF